MPDQPSYPGMEPAPRRSRSRLVLMVIVLVLVIAVAISAYIKKEALMSAWTALTVPQELKGALFVHAPVQGPSVLYAIKGLSFVPMLNYEDFFISFTSAKNRLAVLWDPKTKLYRIEERGAVIATSTSFIYHAAASDDAQWVLYDQFVPSIGTTTKGAAATTAPMNQGGSAYWKSYLYRPATHQITPLGDGFSPVFLDTMHVLKFLPNGLYVLDLSDGKLTSILKLQLPLIAQKVAQSPDRTLIAWYDPATKTTYVYAVSPTSATLKLTLPGVQYFGLSNDALYEVRLGDHREIWKHPLTGGSPQNVLSLPESPKISNLVL